MAAKTAEKATKTEKATPYVRTDALDEVRKLAARVQRLEEQMAAVDSTLSASSMAYNKARKA